MTSQELKKVKAENERLKALLVGLQGDEKLKDSVGDEQSPAPSSKNKVVDRDPEENEKILEIIKEVEEANMKGKTNAPQKKAAPPSAKKVASTKKVAKVAAKKASTPKAAAKTTSSAAVKKVSAPKKKKSPASKNDAPDTKNWSQLSDSTLKRKTIAQLKETLLGKILVEKEPVVDQLVYESLAAALPELTHRLESKSVPNLLNCKCPHIEVLENDTHDTVGK